MRIGICSYYNEPTSGWAKPCADRMERYCRLHGYGYVRPTHKLARFRSPNWQKNDILLRHLGQYDAMCWIDADCVLTNMEFRLEDIVENTVVDADIWLTRDNIHSSDFNNGVMIMRNRPVVVDMLLRWRDSHDSSSNGNDNVAMIPIIHTSDSLTVCWLPQRLINSYPAIHCDGDFLVHFAGLTNRTELAKEWIEKYPETACAA